MDNIDLKSFRKANRLSQAKLAEFLNVGQGFISQIENGERGIPVDLLDKILGNKEWDTSMLIPGNQHRDSELIAALKETIQAQKETIEYQKELIDMLKKEKGISARPVTEDASSVYSQSNR